ncbi:Cbp6p ASCRUDRAFT_72530 [Ascoidea rubescens DSM 1968]|uniref:Uncharacterized protein n=1 Tax=Ascoidea rubescens DSM 1968 TaxID=1344418 RepID=A0A1D2VAA8_9ASCO|nr:hypothetical protein ASCRUDRAFT_72530 [Ascoidea rubescens DSM 1968]ODV58602.1 hypothetical protein ASCRUDRAFT_72530 [Ascoidea rubescens DSM 1968]
MSFKNTVEASRALIRQINLLPYEKLKPSISFKESQYERYRKIANLPQQFEIPYIKPAISEVDFKDEPRDNNTESLKTLTLKDFERQINSLKSLSENKFKKYYEVGDKLYKPNGKPEYYERLMKEINGESKAGIFTALKEVFFRKV